MKCPSSFRFIFLITYTLDEESLDTLYPPFSPFQVTYLILLSLYLLLLDNVICPPRSRASGTPTPAPTSAPTISQYPTARPTNMPTIRPSTPTQAPTISLNPTMSPTLFPTQAPTISLNPTMSPTLFPTLSPTISQNPTLEPTDKPTVNPTLYPTMPPTLTFRKDGANDGRKNMKFDLLGLLLLALPVGAAAYLF